MDGRIFADLDESNYAGKNREEKETHENEAKKESVKKKARHREEINSKHVIGHYHARGKRSLACEYVF